MRHEVRSNVLFDDIRKTDSGRCEIYFFEIPPLRNDYSSFSRSCRLPARTLGFRIVIIVKQFIMFHLNHCSTTTEWYPSVTSNIADDRTPTTPHLRLAYPFLIPRPPIHLRPKALVLTGMAARTTVTH
jgi:hypothetical protein